ncbi:MAG TPA: hypothetical protein VF580_15155 [Thermoanaerobaculia bacterium]
MFYPAAIGLVLFQLVSSHGGAKPAVPAQTAANSAAGVTWTVPKAWLVGPKKTVHKETVDFDALVKSLRRS